MVDYLHERDISHRDLKPDNLVFEKPPMKYKQAKLMVIDFGVAIEMEDDETNGQVKGTPKYMPPEIIKHRTGSEIKKGDVWAIGIIAYILMIGQFPFDNVGNDTHVKHSLQEVEKASNESSKCPSPQSNGNSEQFPFDDDGNDTHVKHLVEEVEEAKIESIKSPSRQSNGISEQFPFDNDGNATHGKNWFEEAVKAKNESIKWPAKQSKGISEQFTHFISKCLHKTPFLRLNARQALEHPWIVDPPEKSLHYINSS